MRRIGLNRVRIGQGLCFMEIYCTAGPGLISAGETARCHTRALTSLQRFEGEHVQFSLKQLVAIAVRLSFVRGLDYLQPFRTINGFQGPGRGAHHWALPGRICTCVPTHTALIKDVWRGSGREDGGEGFGGRGINLSKTGVRGSHFFFALRLRRPRTFRQSRLMRCLKVHD